MKILWIMDQAFPTTNAITKIIDNILKEWESKDISNDVVCLAHTKFEMESVNSNRGVNYYRIDITKQIRRTEICGVKKFQRIYFLYTKLLKTLYLTKRIKQLYHSNRYDAIVSVSWPFFTSIAGALTGKKTKHIVCQFDPYSQYESLPKFKRWIKQVIEMFVFEKVEKIFLMEPIYISNQQTKLKRYLPKMEVLHCCGLKQKDIIENQEKIFTYFNNFLYCGYIQEEVRSTEFTFKTWNHLSEENALYLVGGGIEPPNCKNIFVINRVSPEEADSLLLKADFLVNIGNNYNDQVPSKLIDYFSTGKPIVCFQKSRLSLEVKYLRKYPLALIVFENEMSPKQAAHRIEMFCKEHKGERIKFQEIEAIFENFTPHYVAEQIYSSL